MKKNSTQKKLFCISLTALAGFYTVPHFLFRLSRVCYVVLAFAHCFVNLNYSLTIGKSKVTIFVSLRNDCSNLACSFRIL